MAEPHRFTSDVKRLERWSAEEEEDRTDMICPTSTLERLDDMRCAFQELCQKTDSFRKDSPTEWPEGFSQLWPEWKKVRGGAHMDRRTQCLEQGRRGDLRRIAQRGMYFPFRSSRDPQRQRTEAGQFIRQYLKWEKTSTQQITPTDHFREWTISSTPGQQEQYALVREILEDLIEEKGTAVLERTALFSPKKVICCLHLSALPEG